MTARRLYEAHQQALYPSSRALPGRRRPGMNSKGKILHLRREKPRQVELRSESGPVLLKVYAEQEVLLPPEATACYAAQNLKPLHDVHWAALLNVTFPP